jgi:hypothetical protein
MLELEKDQSENFSIFQPTNQRSCLKKNFLPKKDQFCKQKQLLPEGDYAYKLLFTPRKRVERSIIWLCCRYTSGDRTQLIMANPLVMCNTDM